MVQSDVTPRGVAILRVRVLKEENLHGGYFKRKGALKELQESRVTHEGYGLRQDFR